MAREGFGELIENLGHFDETMQNRLAAILGRGANQLEIYAKTNARWTDRTGFARQSLHTVTYRGSSNYDPTAPSNSQGIALAHGASYGIWLELIQHGQYAIILLSIRTVGPEIMALISRSLFAGGSRR